MIKTSSVLAFTLVMLCLKVSGSVNDKFPVKTMLANAADNVVYCEFFHEITVNDYASTPFAGGNIKAAACKGSLIS